MSPVAFSHSRYKGLRGWPEVGTELRWEVPPAPTSPSNLAGCSVSPSPSSLGRRPRPRGALTMSAPSPPHHRLHPPARPCLCLVSLLPAKTEEGGGFTSPDKLRDAVSPPKRLRLIALPRRKSSEVFLVVG